ncbi:MAG: hypothetical protein LC797_19775 [Chloroflexi bacterium]|nr:hypothetical protein [Chloroflexota bacterium]
MIATASTTAARPLVRRDQVLLPRLVWVAPLTLALALAACCAVRFVAQLVDPRAATMAMLGMPMSMLAVEGTVAAIVAFVAFALFVPRPILWYRVVGGVALLVSLLPDIGLALGGAPMITAMRFVGPLTSIGRPGQGGTGGPPPGRPGAGGPPPGFLSGMSIDQVLVLMALHVAVGLVCIGLLTTLGRKRGAAV